VIIGLTGLYCAGKNHVGRLLEKRDLPVLDADKIGHDVIRQETEKIISRFGEKILDSKGTVDRKLLGKLVFGNPAELATLEAIIHPAVNNITEEWVIHREAEQSGLCVINAALLHKSSVYNRLGAILVVYAPFLVRFFRAIRRDKSSPWGIFKRICSQKDLPGHKNGKTQSQLFSCPADIYTIRNSGFSGSRRNLEKRIDAILEGLNHGKEKIITGRGFGGGISGDRIQRCDPDI